MTSVRPCRHKGVLSRKTYALVVLLRGGEEVDVWPVEGMGPPDAAVVDEIARLQLRARRMGCSIRLRDVSQELFDLLDLLGLGDVVPCVPGLRRGGLPVQVEGEPED